MLLSFLRLLKDTLFYTYPIFNLLGRAILFKEHFTISQFIYILFAIYGCYLISNQNTIHNISSNISSNTLSSLSNSRVKIGIIAGLLSAITESIIYLSVKKETSSTPFQELTRFYLMGGLLSIAFIAYSYYNSYNSLSSNTSGENMANIFKPELPFQLQFDTSLSGNNIGGIVLFNALVGFVGYVLRFYIIPRISTIKFNSMIFLGIIFAYIWGYLISNEYVYIENIIGSLIIIFTIYMVNN